VLGRDAAVAPVTEVCVAHLVWGPLGLGPVEDFAAAYRRHAAGCAHRLVVGFNGVAGAAERARLEAPFAGVAHDTFAMRRPRRTSRIYCGRAADAADYVCCLNSYSTPLADGWLAALSARPTAPASAWSARPARGRATTPRRSGAARAPAARAVAPPLGRVGRPRRAPDGAGRTPRAARGTVPNPHIRSNAFMLRRDLFLSLRAGAGTKRDAERFESGRRG
jgi:hypothetical protein